MDRVLTPIAIPLFFIGYPPFHRLRTSKVVLGFCHPNRHFLHLERCVVSHCDEITVSPRAPNPTASLDWLDPDRSPASGRIALSPLPSSKRCAQNRGCI